MSDRLRDIVSQECLVLRHGLSRPAAARFHEVMYAIAERVDAEAREECAETEAWLLNLADEWWGDDEWSDEWKDEDGVYYSLAEEVYAKAKAIRESGEE